MNYKTYAEAKIASPDSEIVTTAKNWSWHYSDQKVGAFEKQGSHIIRENAWVICNPADYCSTLKEFLDAGFKLVEGDKFIGIGGYIVSVENADASNMRDDEDDCFRYILSAAALNGGCEIQKAKVNKVNYTIEELLGKYAVYGTDECELFLDALESSGATWPNGKKPREDSVDGECVSLDAVDRNIGNCRKKYYEENGYQLFTSKSTEIESESWTIYNNTLQLSELSDELDVKLFRAWRNGGEVQFLTSHNEWVKSKYPFSEPEKIYRIKSKSERELFIAAAINHGIKSQKQTPAQIFGELFDSGRFECKDNTHHFGESI